MPTAVVKDIILGGALIGMSLIGGAFLLRKDPEVKKIFVPLKIPFVR